MAHRSDDARSVHHLALIVLLAGAALFYGWALAPVEHQSQVWNAAGSIARMSLLLAYVGTISNRFLLAVVLWYTGEESQVAACSVAYIVQPWEILPGQAQCSALLQTDIGAYGMAAVAVLLLAYPVRPDRCANG
jgi:hypothetical protein